MWGLPENNHICEKQILSYTKIKGYISEIFKSQFSAKNDFHCFWINNHGILSLGFKCEAL